MAQPGVCLLVQANTTVGEEKAQSWQNVVCYSTNTATIVHTVHGIQEIPIYKE